MKRLLNMLKIVLSIWQPKKLPYLYPMKVRMNDTGEAFEADNEIQLVEKMAFSQQCVNMALKQIENNAAYMKLYARRAVIMNDEDIRSTNEKEFINDLLKLKHIELLQA